MDDRSRSVFGSWARRVFTALVALTCAASVVGGLATRDRRTRLAGGAGQGRQRRPGVVHPERVGRSGRLDRAGGRHGHPRRHVHPGAERRRWRQSDPPAPARLQCHHRRAQRVQPRHRRRGHQGAVGRRRPDGLRRRLFQDRPWRRPAGPGPRTAERRRGDGRFHAQPRWRRHRLETGRRSALGSRPIHQGRWGWRSRRWPPSTRPPALICRT